MTKHRETTTNALLRAAALGAVAGLALIAAAPAGAQDKQYQMATTPAGSIVNATGSAIAGVVSQKTAIKMLVSPYGGPQVIVPMLNDGQADFTLMNAADAYEAARGVKPAYRQASPNLRLVSVGFTNTVGLMVRADSPIRTAADLKGHRVTGAFSQQKTCDKLTKALLATASLGMGDVTVVPVTHSVPAANALAEGRAEVATCMVPNMAVIKEIHVRSPIRFIGIDPSPEAVQRAHKEFPAGRPVQIKAGAGEGVTEDIHLWGYDFYLVTHAGEDPQVVYEVTKTVWENLPELRKIHRAFHTWKQEGMADADVTIPFHPGAVKFFREKGVWTPAMEDANAKVAADIKK